nr:D52 [uncultured bacterium]
MSKPDVRLLRRRPAEFIAKAAVFYRECGFIKDMPALVNGSKVGL